MGRYPDLNHMASLSSILSLARVGATNRAWEAFTGAGLDKQRSDPAVLTLKGRLLKDRARAAGGAAGAELFSQSAQAYTDAAAIQRTASYPLINAATMALLAGQGARAATLADQILTLLDGGQDNGETPYWGEATRAEALLLLGRRTEAEKSLERAIKFAPLGYEDHAVTLRQFRAILKLAGDDAKWVDRFAPPPCLHFSGMIGISPDDLAAATRINEAIERIAPAFGFGALAAGADILIAEALIACQAELYVYLPGSIEDFRATSVAPFGEGWLPRFDSLIDAAVGVEILDDGQQVSSASIGLCEEFAMGCAIEHARRLECVASSLRVTGDTDDHRADIWSVTTLPLETLALPRTATLPDEPPLPTGKYVTYLALSDTIAINAPETACGSWNEGDIIVFAFDRIDDALIALDTLRSSGAEHVIAALDCRILKTGIDTDSMRASVVRMVKAAAPGAVVATKGAAMATMLRRDRVRIEPLGEIASIAGGIEIYALVKWERG